MKLLKNKKLSRGAQTAIELAVFGSILIFVIGLIVRTGLSNAQRQNHALRGIRMAMKISFESSEGLWGTGLCGGNTKACGPGVSANSSASVLLVEDRLSTDLSKYGAKDRIPLVIASSGTHSRNLYLPIDPGETWNLPMVHYIINGQHFPFTLVNFGPRAYSKSGGRKYPTKVPNYPGIKDWNPGASGSPCVGCWTPWDTDCDGSDDVPLSLRDNFAWQWGATKVEQGSSVDVDGDCKEEQVIKANKHIFYVMDPQLGDLDSSRGSSDPGPTPGLQNDMYLYSEIKPGTFLQIAKAGLTSISVQKKESVDLVERIIILSSNTERFCRGNTVVNPVVGTNIQNPVEVCSASCSSGGAHSGLTCYDTDGSDGSLANIIYVRSRVKNIQGRKWMTDFSNDDYVGFTQHNMP